ncbi:antifreeze protein [Falsochrobactrum shanghaiense]|uniref:Antifreeze protein n=1 Tax=Falsochrobactrum shanghaiense TaxID=2201899 RepID=A0A316J688_9HYPH|nr:PepSY domain-containing protein [Falsochrobactrum shanghaiense]PWL17377.1 antifreeze protein [Falsochrobactrum shanghaiense]
MRKSVLAFAALATIATAYTVPSFAAGHGSVIEIQWHDGHRDRRPDWGNDRRRGAMGPRQIARSLERRGYAVGDMDRRRDTYRIRATRPRGGRVILTVDAYSGRILDERRVGRGR